MQGVCSKHVQRFVASKLHDDHCVIGVNSALKSDCSSTLLLPCRARKLQLPYDLPLPPPGGKDTVNVPIADSQTTARIQTRSHARAHPQLSQML